jgi:ATP-dependent protease ClpP protease subunit
MRLLPMLVLFSCAAVPVGPSTIFFKGDVDEATLQGVTNAIGAAPGNEVTLIITSPGGNVFAGMEFIQDIERLKVARGLKIHCIGDIVVASMAADIFESDVCDDRALTNRTVLLFHAVQAPASPIKVAIDHAVAAMISPHLQMKPGDLENLLNKGDWVLTPEQAVEAHAADRIIFPE